MGWVEGCSTISDDIQEPGVGGVFYDPASGILEGFVHQLTDEEQKEALREQTLSVPWIEILGAVLWMELYAGRCEASRVLLALDADTATQALARAFSADADMLQLIQRYRRKAAEFFVMLRVRSVVGEWANRVADHLSHFRVQDAIVLAWTMFGKELVVRRL